MATIKETTTTTTALAEPLADGKKIEPPKKAQSPLVLWGRAGALAAIKAAHPEWSRPEILRALSKNWEALSAGLQKPWLDRAAEDQKRFDAEKAAYDETPEGKAALAAVEEEPPAKKPRTKAPALATMTITKKTSTKAPVVKKKPVLKPRAAPIDLPTVDSELTTAEKAAVLRAISEASGSSTQKDVQHAAERILGAPLDALAAKGRAIWALAALQIDHSAAGRELVVVPNDDELPADDEGDDNDIIPASQPRGPPRDRSKASVAFVGGEDDDSVVEEELEEIEEELIEAEMKLSRAKAPVKKAPVKKVPVKKTPRARKTKWTGLGRGASNKGRAWGKGTGDDATKYIECYEGTPYNPGPAVDGAKELLAEAVPEACLGYPDYKKKRGANFLKKGSSASTNKFYKKNGYWKIAVYGHHGSSSEAIFKFFKEVKRA